MAAAQAGSLDRLFHALSDANRRGMVDRLARGPASVKELAEPGSLALPSAMKHLRVLEEGGLVRSRKSGRVRTYSIEPHALGRVEAWVAERKRGLNLQFDGLEAYLAGAETAEQTGTEE